MNNIGKLSAMTVAASLCAIASAQTTGTGTLQISSVSSTSAETGSMFWEAGGVNGSYGGPFYGTYTPITPAGGTPVVNFGMYCLSVPEEFNWAPPTAGFAVDVSLQNTAAGWLVDNQSTLFAAEGVTANSSAAVDNAATTALQCAIWTETPTSNSLPGQTPSAYNAYNEGILAGYATTLADYNTDLSMLGSKTSQAYYFTIPNYQNSGDGQPQISPYSPGSPQKFGIVAPGPEAFLPFALGFLGLFLKRKKARKLK